MSELFHSKYEIIKGRNYSDVVKEACKILYRFYGVTADKYQFCVQIREDTSVGRRDFMSVFDVRN